MTTFQLELKLSGVDLAVRTFEAHEGLNQPFLVALTGVSKDPDLDLDAPIGADAAFVVRVDGKPRTYTGIVRRFDQVSADDEDTAGSTSLSTYLVEIVPKLWALGQTRNHRAFQNMSELDVALAVLEKWKIEPELRLDRARYRRREIRIQYGESDLVLFARLLEEIGVSYWFEPREDRTVMVLDDAPHGRKPVRLPYREEGRFDEACVSSISIERRLRPGRYTLRDRDFRRPTDTPLEASEAADGVTELEASLERYHYVHGAFLFEADTKDTPVADDRIAARSDQNEAAAKAVMRIRAKRGDARLAAFSCSDFAMGPGHTVIVTGHPARELGEDRPLLVHTTVLRGRHDRVFPLECDGRSALVPFHPPLVSGRPRVNGIETATVVGPKGEEIHTDEFGRVRVHFHWDRESKLDERSSCWLHAAQPWAGTGYGGVNLPRGGQEVLVEFVAGDPDRPIIVGRVFTDLQKVPYTLPLNKTQSGWKSNSTGGTGGFNEIMFEDKDGDELVRMRAQKDLQTKVKRNEDRDVRNDRTTVVKRNDSRIVRRDQDQSIEGYSQKRIQGTSDTLVRQDASAYVRNNARVTVAQQKSDFTGGTSTTENGSFRDISVENRRVVGAANHEYTGGNSAVNVTGGGQVWKLGASKIDVNYAEVKVSSGRISLEVKTMMVHSPSIKLKGLSSATLRGEVTTIMGGLVSLNGPHLPVARVTEPAPDKVRNGAGTVQIGGPSLPDGAVVNEDGSITIGGITIQGDPAFISRTIADLVQMGKTPRGKQLLKSLMDPKEGKQITITDGSFEGSKAEQDWWGWLTGKPSSSGVKYDPYEANGDIPRDAILYDNLRQGERLRNGQELDPNWLDEEKEYLKERKWPKYRVDDSGTYEKF